MNGRCPLTLNLLLEQEAKETKEGKKKNPHKIRTEKSKKPWLWRKSKENFKSILKTLCKYICLHKHISKANIIVKMLKY